jgi:hypothetical protein
VRVKDLIYQLMLMGVEVANCTLPMMLNARYARTEEVLAHLVVHEKVSSATGNGSPTANAFGNTMPSTLERPIVT